MSANANGQMVVVNATRAVGSVKAPVTVRSQCYGLVQETNGITSGYQYNPGMSPKPSHRYC